MVDPVNGPRMFGGLHHDVLFAFTMNDELAPGNHCAAFEDLAHFHLLAFAHPRASRQLICDKIARRAASWEGASMTYDCKTSDDVLRMVKDDKIEMIDLRFTDLPGLWQHFSVPPSALKADSFSD